MSNVKLISDLENVEKKKNRINVDLSFLNENADAIVKSCLETSNTSGVFDVLKSFMPNLTRKVFSRWLYNYKKKSMAKTPIKDLTEGVKLTNEPEHLTTNEIIINKFKNEKF